ncbi:MAG: hypothetical protein ACI4SZ_00875 [Lachnospiraceae bacterium]
MKEEKVLKVKVWLPVVLAALSAILVVCGLWVRMGDIEMSFFYFAKFIDDEWTKMAFTLAFALLFAIFVTMRRYGYLKAIKISAIILFVVEIISGVMNYLCSIRWMVPGPLNVFERIPGSRYVLDLWYLMTYGSTQIPAKLPVVIGNLLAIATALLVAIFAAQLMKKVTPEEANENEITLPAKVILTLWLSSLAGYVVRVLLTLPGDGISAVGILVVAESMLMTVSFYLMLTGRKVGFYLCCAVSVVDIISVVIVQGGVIFVVGAVLKLVLIRLVLLGSWKDMR